MKQNRLKHFMLLLLCMVATGAWADPTYKSDFTLNQVLMLTTADVDSYKGDGWVTQAGPTPGDHKLKIDPATDETISGTKASYYRIKQQTSRNLSFYVTGVKKIKFYFDNSGSDDRTVKADVNSDASIDLVTVTQKTSASAELTFTDGTANNKVTLWATGDIAVCAMKITELGGPKDPVFSFEKSTFEVGENVYILVDGQKMGNLGNINNWTSTLDGLHMFSDGYIRCDEPGSGTLTFDWKSNDADKYNSVTGQTLDFKVVSVKTAVTLAYNPVSGTAKVGDIVNTTLDVTGATLADLTDAEALTYTSSDATVATVDANGTITAVAPGTATITASLKEDAAYKGEDATFTLTVLSNACKLLQAKFSNGFNAFITEPDGEENGKIQAYYLAGTEVPTLQLNTIQMSKNAHSELVGNLYRVVAQDGVTTASYDIVAPVAVEPLKGVTEYQFDGTESWIKSGGKYVETSGEKTYYAWVINKLSDTDNRIPIGKTRIYFFVGKAESVKLINDRGTALSADRAIKVYVNGVEQSSPTSMPKYNADAPASISITTGEAAMIEISSNQTSGDTGWGKIEIIGGVSEADLTLTDAVGEETNADRISAMETKDDVTVTVARSVKADQWNTIYLPFAMTAEQIAGAFGEGTKVAGLASYDADNENLMFTSVTETAANTAYLLKPANDVEEFTVEGVDVTYVADKDLSNPLILTPGALFEGVIDNQTIATPASLYYLANGNKIKLLAENGQLKALHGYFIIGGGINDDPFSAKTFTVDGAATGIIAVENGEQLFRSGEMYNTAGQRVNDSYRGVVIVNGKKVIKK